MERKQKKQVKNVEQDKVVKQEYNVLKKKSIKELIESLI